MIPEIPVLKFRFSKKLVTLLRRSISLFQLHCINKIVRRLFNKYFIIFAI